MPKLNGEMDTNESIHTIIRDMHRVFLGQDEVLKNVLCALLARGHVLLEGVPGVGKTLIAITLSRLLHLSFKRIQFTNDLLPTDVTGFHTFKKGDSSLDLIPGPIFANIVLADEINRTSPKTQSALLEAMEESQVTIDGKTYRLPDPFMVIATQNPVEIVGTFPLPESQLDRFLMKTRVGYPPLEEETEILKKDIDHADALRLEPVMGRDEINALIQASSQVMVHEDILSYMTKIIRTTRVHPRVDLGVSPRGGLALKRASQAWACISGRNYVIPDDVKQVARYVLEHRIMVKDGSAGSVIGEVLDEVKLPL